MGTRKKLKEYRRVYRQVATDTKAPKSCKAPNGCKVRRTGSDKTKNAGDAECKVEGPFPAKDITAEAPEHTPCKQSDVLSESQKGRTGRRELIRDWCDFVSPMSAWNTASKSHDDPRPWWEV